VFIVPQQGAVTAQAPPQRSIFEITVWEISSGHSVSAGTAFFISPDGRALTASHVVYWVRNDRRYRLLAVVGKEFYGASLTCASELSDDPTKTDKPVRLGRDVAEIRLTRPDFPFDSIVYGSVPYATAHQGSLPVFPALAFGPEPRIGDHVRVLGFGVKNNQPLPYEWSAAGEVTRTGRLDDGTPVFDVSFFAKPATPGHSGSPVLNMADQVVGLLDWNNPEEIRVGTAISSAALDPACP
jgi:S1-C subfamily serine protease